MSKGYVRGGQGHVGDVCELMSHVEGNDGLAGDTKDVGRLSKIHVDILTTMHGVARLLQRCKEQLVEEA